MYMACVQDGALKDALDKLELYSNFRTVEQLQRIDWRKLLSAVEEGVEDSLAKAKIVVNKKGKFFVRFPNLIFKQTENSLTLYILI